MQQQVKFDKQLRHFLTMAVEVWPTLRSASRHLTEVSQPHPASFLPAHNYSTMNYQQFSETIASDLFDFIMTHDVKAEDIEDYLYDVLDLLMVEEQLSGGSSNPASIQSMALLTTEVIKDLQNGKKDKVIQFEESVYSHVKQFQGEVVIEKKGEGEEGDEEQDSCSEEEEESEEERPKQFKEKEQPNLQEKELQDDGWVIVRKKGR